MSRAYDVAVVGSGIVGLGAAYAAVRRGLRVVVIDRTTEPVGATIRNFGHICLTPQTGDALRYGLVARELWLRLAMDAGFWVRESGTLVVARHADELAVLESHASRSRTEFEGRREIEMLDATEARRRTLAPGAIGGAHLPLDLQTDPRAAAPAIVAHLARLGVDFLTRTSVGRVESGRVETSRGDVFAGTVVVAVNHDIDQLLPSLAEAYRVERCALDMLRAVAPFARPLDSPLLTGWSLLRYGAFAELPATGVLRERLHTARPDLAAVDLNQMYTQLPDGTLIVGDTHARSSTVQPFQTESASDLLIEETELLFGVPLRVLERWQGVYASAPAEFLVAEPEPGVHALAATTGIGMTTGLGLAELTLAAAFDAVGSRTEGIR